MADEELRLVATLDDRASDGLARLQANVRQLGSGQNAQAMVQMQRQTGGVVEGLKNMASGFSNAMTGMVGFGAIAAAVPVALAGMAASFATSGINKFAEDMSDLGRKADAAGIGLAQYKANMSTLKTAGITDAEAEATIKRFSRIQTELGQMGSKVRNEILAQTPLYGKDEMDQWLNDVMVLPTNQAMQKVRDRGKEIRQSVYDQSRAEGKNHADAMRIAADAEEAWLTQWSATALANIRKPFREATQDEEDLMTRRREAADAWGDAVHDISGAWGDIKGTIGSIAMEALLPVAQGIARAMRGAADAVRIVEQWWKKPEGATVVDLVDDLERRFPGLEPLWTPLREFLRDPPPGLVGMWKQLKTDASGFWESTKKDWEVVKSAGKAVWEFMKLPEEDQTFLALIKSFEQQFPAFERRAKPIREWFEKPPDERSFISLMKAVEQSVPEIEKYIRPVREFIEDPKGTLLRYFNDIKAVALDLVPKSIMDFINEPSWNNFNQMIADAQTAFANMIPQWVRDFWEKPSDALLKMVDSVVERMSDAAPQWLKDYLGIGEAAAAAAPTGEELFGLEHGGGGIPVQEAAPPPPVQQAAPGFFKRWTEKLKPMQQGGIVTQPTPALLGEAGPEAILPLSKPRTGMGGTQWSTSDIIASMGGLAGAMGFKTAAALARIASTGTKAALAPPGSLREARTEALKFAHPAFAWLEGMKADLAKEEVQQGLKGVLPEGLVDALVGFSTGEAAGPKPRGISELLGGLFDSTAGAMLDRSAAQQVNVSGTGRIMVDVRSPESKADTGADGLFKSVEIARQTSMMPAEYGPLAATGVNAGAGSYG